jgi:2,3-bisphosphoglycerate-independent phosphoglycerate mutase
MLKEKKDKAFRAEEKLTKEANEIMKTLHEKIRTRHMEVYVEEHFSSKGLFVFTNQNQISCKLEDKIKEIYSKIGASFENVDRNCGYYNVVTFKLLVNLE